VPKTSNNEQRSLGAVINLQSNRRMIAFPTSSRRTGMHDAQTATFVPLNRDDSTHRSRTSPLAWQSCRRHPAGWEHGVCSRVLGYGLGHLSLNGGGSG